MFRVTDMFKIKVSDFSTNVIVRTVACSNYPGLVSLFWASMLYTRVVKSAFASAAMSRESTDFVVDSFSPAYLEPSRRDELYGRAQVACEALYHCTLCPRACEVDRSAGGSGFCQTAMHAQICSAFAHMGEETCLRGACGSGTIFFARCNLHCVFCQNYDISQSEPGHEASAEQIAEIMLALQDKGCHNINFVTPTHVVPQIIEAIALAVDDGLRVPIVYNTGAYDQVETIRQLDGLVDIYMPDFKFWSSACCGRYLNAEDYGQRAREAIAEMHRQVGDLRFTSDGLACGGVLIRHLVMPGLPDESRAIFQWLADELSRDTFVNIMAQYHPDHHVGRKYADDQGYLAIRYEEINNSPNVYEIRNAHEQAREAGLWRFDKQAFN